MTTHMDLRGRKELYDYFESILFLNVNIFCCLNTYIGTRFLKCIARNYCYRIGK